MTERTNSDKADPTDRISEPARDQVSAFLDDELSEEETAFLVRRFERDPEVRNQLIRYATIGSALRGELVRPDHDILRRRVAAALGGPLPPQQQRPVRAWRPRVLQPVVRVGIAAAVAVAAVVALREVNDLRSSPSAALEATPVQARQQWTEPPSYVVPQDTAAESRPVMAPIRLTNYMLHHGEYASRLSRTSVHSNVVGSSDRPIQPVSEDQQSLE